jgi:hypothetical protein
MIFLEKNENYIRITGDSGSWFLKEYRMMTSNILENGLKVVGVEDLEIEIENNIFLMKVSNLQLDGLNFDNAESLKNYLLYGEN